MEGKIQIETVWKLVVVQLVLNLVMWGGLLAFTVFRLQALEFELKQWVLIDARNLVDEYLKQKGIDR